MDLLLSFSEFDAFKEMMLFARAHFVATTPKPKSSKAAALGLKSGAELAAETGAAAAGTGIVGISTEGASKMKAQDMLHFESCIDGLQIAGRRTHIHHDEVTEGEARPDLDLMGFGIGGSGAAGAKK